MSSSSLLPSKAATYLGTQGRPNTFSTWYAARHGKEYLTAPWCAMFISYVANRLGLGKAIGEFAYCPYWVEWFKARKQWGRTPRVGALVFFDWNGDKVADHVGIVESIGGNGFYSLEGNTGGRPGEVIRHNRGMAKVLGFGYPVIPASVKPKLYTVVRGDTLISIAKRFYDDPQKWKLIYEKNKKVIGKNPAMIRPGQKLVLP